MARGRSRAERDEQFVREERLHWEGFKAALARVPGRVEALLLAQQSPGPDRPGRTYHSNLAFFLQSFVVPNVSSEEERLLYLGLVRRMDAAGQLKEGALQQVEEAFDVAARGGK